MYINVTDDMPKIDIEIKIKILVMHVSCRYITPNVDFAPYPFISYNARTIRIR